MYCRYRNIWFKVEEAIEIYVNVFWICVCLLAALSIYGWRMHELLDTCNRTMEIQEGVIKDVVLIDTVTQYDDFDIYEVTLYGRERPIEKVVSGMHVRIDAYRSSFYGTLVSRIDGKTPEYYKKIMEHKNVKTQTVLLLLMLQSIEMLIISGREYVKHGKRKQGRRWFWFAAVLAELTILVPLAAIKYPQYGRVLSWSEVIMLILYVIAEMRLAWQANVGSNWKLWEEVRYIWHIEGEDSDTEEESPKYKEISYQVHQMQQMSISSSERYCRYRYKNGMKEVRFDKWACVVVGLDSAFLAWLVTLGSGSDASIWGIVVAGIIFALVMIIWGTKIFGKKWESYKMEMESRVPCEYCCIKEDVFENMKFRCSDGHDEIWRMNLDEEAKVKDGETVMVIFMPTAMEMRLERLPYMDKIWEG